MRASPDGIVISPDSFGGADPGDAGQARDVARVERLVELAAHADELLQVLDPPARLDRPLRLELGDVAGVLEDHLDGVRDAVGRGGLEAGHQLEQVADARRAPCR